MRIVTRLSGAALAAALMLSGCVSAPTPVRPAPKPSATPVFASEAEALAAATKAYAAYVKVSDEITADSGSKPERISQYVTAAQFTRDTAVFAKYSAAKMMSRGATRFDRIRVQSYNDGSNTPLALVAYLCLNLSGIKLIDSQGLDITPPGLDRPSPMQVTFTSSGTRKDLVLVERSESWSGEDFCSS